MPRVFRYAADTNAPLPQNAPHMHAANYALSIYPSDAVYSFIPKNACTTLRYSLALAHGAIEDESKFSWIHDNNQTFRATLPELVRARYAFVILRDPFLRLASCFLDKFVDQTAVALSFERSQNQPGSRHDLTFRDFVASLGALLRADEHWRPQVDYLVYKTYDDVFCLEDFGVAVSTLKAKIDFDVHDARRLSRHGADQYEAIAGDDCAADLSAFDLLALKRTGKAPQLRKFYDAGLVDKVAALYADDLALYRDWTGRKPIF